MEITIAGYGFVGKAHAKVLKEYYDINIADPILLETTISDYVDETEVVICCVSTPQADDGSCDIFKGGKTWLKELDEVEKVIGEGIDLGWSYGKDVAKFR